MGKTTQCTAGAKRAAEALIAERRRWESRQYPGGLIQIDILELAAIIDRETRPVELLAAIKGVSNCGGCWCCCGEGNPTVHECSPNCIRLGNAIAAVEKA